MTPELKLAQSLSSEDEKQKLASEMETLSIEELEGILKEGFSVTEKGHKFDAEHAEMKKRHAIERGKLLQDHDAIGYVDPVTNKNPAKLLNVVRFLSAGGDPRGTARHQDYVAKKHREGKNAWNPMGGEFTPVKEEKGAKPGFLGTYGKYETDKKAGIEDVGDADLLQMADELGRELAHKEKKAYTLSELGLALGGVAAGVGGYALGKRRGRKEKKAASFNQVNEASKIPGRVLRLYDRVKGPVGSAAKAVGNKAHGAVKSLGTNIGNIKDPILKGTAIGAVTGGAGGAVSGLLDPKEDPMTGEKQRMKSMVRRGLSGAAGGAATGALFGSIGKTSSVSVQKLASALEKRALTMAGVGSMAKNFVGQMKPVAQKAMAAAKPMAQNAMAKAAPMAVQHLGGKTMGQVAGMGAAGGAAIGAAKGLVAPGKDAQGQQKSRLGSMARGAVGGAAVGGALGAGAKAAVPHLQNAYKAVTPGLTHGAQMRLPGM